MTQINISTRGECIFVRFLIKPHAARLLCFNLLSSILPDMDVERVVRLRRAAVELRYLKPKFTAKHRVLIDEIRHRMRSFEHEYLRATHFPVLESVLCETIEKVNVDSTHRGDAIDDLHYCLFCDPKLELPADASPGQHPGVVSPLLDTIPRHGNYRHTHRKKHRKKARSEPVTGSSTFRRSDIIH